MIATDGLWDVISSAEVGQIAAAVARGIVSASDSEAAAAAAAAAATEIEMASSSGQGILSSSSRARKLVRQVSMRPNRNPTVADTTSSDSSNFGVASSTALGPTSTMQASHLAAALASQAYERGSADNICVVVVDLR